MGVEGKTVLVVDDEPSIRLLCRVNLELDGYRALEAATIEDARRQLDHRVAVVLLDVHLGLEDGRDFLQELRRDHPHVRVALLTGSTDLASLGNEADAALAKPFELSELAAVVQ